MHETSKTSIPKDLYQVIFLKLPTSLIISPLPFLEDMHVELPLEAGFEAREA